MDRPITYYGALARALDGLLNGQYAMVGTAKIAEAVLGTNTCVSAFTCVPTAPASMSVNITPGQIYQLANLEASAISLLNPDTHSVVKQGLLLDATSLTLVAPTTVGFSINILIEAQYADSDSGQTLLNYYNATNPTVPYQGPGNNGQQQPTIRKGTVSLQAKYGTAATSGTQATPAPDAGWVGLFVVTVSFGQTSITAGSIALYPGAPFIPTTLMNLPSYVMSLIGSSARRTLSAPLTIYVRTDGNDANSGAVNTSIGAFATIQAAWNSIKGKIDSSGYAINIVLGIPGTYAGAYFDTQSNFRGQINLVGDTTNTQSTAATYVIGPCVTPVPTAPCCINNEITQINMQGILIDSSNVVSGAAIGWGLVNSGYVSLDNVAFRHTTSATNLVQCGANSAGKLLLKNTISFLGGGTVYDCMQFGNQGALLGSVSAAIIAFNNLTVSNATIEAYTGSTLSFQSITPSGSGVTGKKFLIGGSSYLQSYGTYTSIPGSVAGTADASSGYA